MICRQACSDRFDPPSQPPAHPLITAPALFELNDTIDAQHHALHLSVSDATTSHLAFKPHISLMGSTSSAAPASDLAVQPHTSPNPHPLPPSCATDHVRMRLTPPLTIWCLPCCLLPIAAAATTQAGVAPAGGCWSHGALAGCTVQAVCCGATAQQVVGPRRACCSIWRSAMAWPVYALWLPPPSPQTQPDISIICCTMSFMHMTFGHPYPPTPSLMSALLTPCTPQQLPRHRELVMCVGDAPYHT